MKRLAAPCFAFMSAMTAVAFAQDTSNSIPYTLFQGTVGGTPITILLDRSSGKLWYLAEIDSKGTIWITPSIAVIGTPLNPIWVQMQFAPSAPAAPAK
jgi:hypothetical protein